MTNIREKISNYIEQNRIPDLESVLQSKLEGLTETYRQELFEGLNAKNISCKNVLDLSDDAYFKLYELFAQQNQGSLVLDKHGAMGRLTRIEETGERIILFPFAYHYIAKCENSNDHYYSQVGVRIFRFNVETMLLEQLVDNDWMPIAVVDDRIRQEGLTGLSLEGEQIIGKRDSKNRKSIVLFGHSSDDSPEDFGTVALFDKNLNRLSNWYLSISVRSDNFVVEKLSYRENGKVERIINKDGNIVHS